MKVLRLFLILHTDLKWVVDGAGNSNGRYTKTKLSRDFPYTLYLNSAEALIHEEFGAPPEATGVAYPAKFARVVSHAICDDTPELGHVEEVRGYQPDLLSAQDLKNAQGAKPARK